MRAKVFSVVLVAAAFGATGCGGGGATTGGGGGGTAGGSSAGGSGGNGGGSSGGGSGGAMGGGHSGGGSATGGSGGGSATGGSNGGGSATGGSSGGGSAMGGGSAAGGIGGGDPLAGGADCGSAAAISAAGVITGTTMGGTSSFDFGDTGACQGRSSAGPANAPDTTYKFTLAAGQRLTVTLQPDSMWDPILNLVAAPASNCGMAGGADAGTTGITCVAGSDHGSKGDSETASYFNSGTAAVDVFILIDGYSGTDSGPFHLQTTLSSPMAGDVCATAVDISAAMTLATESLVGYGNDFSGLPSSCDESSSGPDRVYKIEVPAMQRVTATAQATVGDLAIDFIDGPEMNCESPTDCLAASDMGFDADPEVVRYTNSTASTHTVYLVVSEFGTVAAGETFSLIVAFDTAPAGDTCSSAQALPGATTLATESLANFGSDFGGFVQGCYFADGPDKVYTLAVPALNSATFTVQATVGDLNLSVIDGDLMACVMPTYCAAGAGGAGDAMPDTAVFNNTTNASKTVYAVVGEGSVMSGETYSLTVALASIPAPPAGDVCSSATAIATSGTLATQTTTGFYNDYDVDLNSTTCGSTFQSPGNDRVYSVSVGAGQTLSVTVTPTGTDMATENPVVFLVASPATTCTTLLSTCLNGADDGQDGDPEMLTYMNSGASAQTVYIVVDSYNPGAMTEFSVTTALTP